MPTFSSWNEMCHVKKGKDDTGSSSSSRHHGRFLGGREKAARLTAEGTLNAKMPGLV